MRLFPLPRSADPRTAGAAASFEDALASAPDAVLGLTTTGAIVRMNAAATALFGARRSGTALRAVVDAESAATSTSV